MKRWTSMMFVFGHDPCLQPVWVDGQGRSWTRGQSGRGHGTGSVYAQNSHGNGQGTIDRDLGKDRATEVGHGKKKGLHKDQYWIGDGGDKDHNHDSHKKDKDKVKKQHKEKKDKD